MAQSEIGQVHMLIDEMKMDLGVKIAYCHSYQTKHEAEEKKRHENVLLKREKSSQMRDLIA